MTTLMLPLLPVVKRESVPIRVKATFQQAAVNIVWRFFCSVFYLPSHDINERKKGRANASSLSHSENRIYMVCLSQH